jgi:hypothetical protein
MNTTENKRKELEAQLKALSIEEQIRGTLTVKPWIVGSESWRGKTRLVFKVDTLEELRTIKEELNDTVQLTYATNGCAAIYSPQSLEKEFGERTFETTEGETLPYLEYLRIAGKAIDLKNPYWINISNSRHTGSKFEVNWTTEKYDVSVIVDIKNYSSIIARRPHKDPHATEEKRRWTSTGGDVQIYCAVLSHLDLREQKFYGNSFKYFAVNDKQAKFIEDLIFNEQAAPLNN